ncbi:MAG TPA: hypothetical protein PLA50_07810 [Bacteroidia bacterium]|nr:hypothetical protein [Bacteroidia bacterium]
MTEFPLKTAWAMVVGLVAGIVGLPLASWAAPVDLTPPKNALEYADQNGQLRYVHRFGDVEFSDNFVLPLRFDFSSGRVVEGARSDFGWHGWACGAIESHAEVLDQGRSLRIQLLCAKTMVLRKEGGEDGVYRTDDGEWTGRVEGDRISVRRDDGWDLAFVSGRVSSLATDRGRVIRWHRDGEGRLLSVQEEGTDAPQIELGWKDDRLATLETRQQDFRFQFAGDTLRAVQWLAPEGVESQFSCWQDARSLRIETPSLREYRFAWLEGTGIILGDGINRYALESRQVPGGGGGIEEMTMTRPDGRSVTIELGNPAGAMRQRDSAGREFLTSRVMAEGPSYAGVLKVEMLREEGGPQLLMSNAYDGEGRIVERFWFGDPFRHRGYGEGRIDPPLVPDRRFVYDAETPSAGAPMHRIQFHYGEGGKLETVSVDQKPVLRFGSDEQGRVTEIAFEGRFRRTFSYAESGEVVESLGLPESSDGPFWYLDHEGDGIGPDLVVEKTLDDAGRLLRQRYADGRTLSVDYDAQRRRATDTTLARDGKTPVRSVRYVYGQESGQRVLRIDEDLLTRNIVYSEILVQAVGSDVAGAKVPQEVALSRVDEGNR